MRLLCDREDAQPCPWTSHNPTEVLSHNMSCWIYLPLSVSSSHPPSLCLSLLPLLSSLTVIQDCQTESETSRQTAQRGLQKHGGVVSKVKQSCRARRQLLTSQQKHASHCHLSFLLFLIHGLHFTNTSVSGEQYILGKSWTIILEKINLSKHRIRIRYIQTHSKYKWLRFYKYCYYITFIAVTQMQNGRKSWFQKCSPL